MRSWTPRRPSPALERRIFSPERRLRDRSSRSGAAWGWLAPVACVFVLALQLLPDANNRLADRLDPDVVRTTAALSNRILAAQAPSWAHSAMNNVNGETFESTNWTTAPSPMRTLPVFLTLTNGLIR